MYNHHSSGGSVSDRFSCHDIFYKKDYRMRRYVNIMFIFTPNKTDNMRHSKMRTRRVTSQNTFFNKQKSYSRRFQLVTNITLQGLLPEI